MATAGRLTPMLRHYLEVKAEHEDALLFYRMGDFYELFFDDARIAAPLMEVTLTARHKGTDAETPMCGVPHHALNAYLGKLVRRGYRVAICDQVEDPAQAKGLVKREVTRVVTPGTLTEPALLDGREESLLVSLAWDGDRGAGAFLDVSTGSFFLRRWTAPEEGVEDLRLLRPSEVLRLEGDLPRSIEEWVERDAPCRTVRSAESWFADGMAAETLQRQLSVNTLRGLGLENDEPAVVAAAAALGYARETQNNDLAHIRDLTVRDIEGALVLDATSVANLEIFRNLREGGRKGTLLAVLDKSVTASGGRLLREWLRRPLREPLEIDLRLDAVEELSAAGALRDGLREQLKGISDLERLLARAVLGSMMPREAAALRDGLARVPAIVGLLEGAASEILRTVAAADPLAELQLELERLLQESPAATLKDGGVIAEGVDDDLDTHRSLARDSKRHILALEARERERTGISSLKIRYNKVFGYYLEVTRSNQHRVPEEYIRKQTLVNAERYVTPEVKELEEKILAAEERQLRLEAEHFRRLQEGVAARGPGLSDLARALATLDVLAGLADVAARRRYCRPRIAPAGDPIVIREGRHPVVERSVVEDFVPNDTVLDSESAEIVLLTGPNMGGKSTYLRQVALVVLMAQAGSFVPADEASIGVVDRIFTRVGASDDLARGESTFMVEMIETANILHHATPHSLVVLDEVGRGTATFDGLSLAWAIVEFLHERRRSKTLFATHYHELTELATILPRVVNRTMAVKEWEERIVFLRRVVEGSADKSYGLHVARLAGVPESVVVRAREILSNLEAQEYDMQGRPKLARGNSPAVDPGPDQLGLFTPAEEVLVGILRDLDVEQLTPLAALNLLHSLKSRLDEPE